jgi:hypothetical protein
MSQHFRLKLPRAPTLGDTKIKSWYDGLFKSGLAILATTGLIREFPYTTEQPWKVGVGEVASAGENERLIPGYRGSSPQIS